MLAAPGMGKDDGADTPPPMLPTLLLSTALSLASVTVTSTAPTTSIAPPEDPATAATDGAADAATDVESVPPAKAPMSTAAPDDVPTPDDVTTTTTTEPSVLPVVGVSLLASGAGLAALGTVGFTLLEAVSTPDRRNQDPPDAVLQFNAVSGFIGVATASVSAVLMVIGAGIVIANTDGPAGALSDDGDNASVY